MSTPPTPSPSAVLAFDVEARDLRRPRAWLAFARYVVELAVVFGLGVRGLCYFTAAFVAESIRLGHEPVFDDADSVELRWAVSGPGFEHERQSRWEIRLAAVFCVAAAVVLFKTIAVFPMDGLQAAALYANCGVLVLDPAWAEVYFQITSDSGDSLNNI